MVFVNRIVHETANVYFVTIAKKVGHVYDSHLFFITSREACLKSNEKEILTNELPCSIFKSNWISCFCLGKSKNTSFITGKCDPLMWKCSLWHPVERLNGQQENGRETSWQSLWSWLCECLQKIWAHKRLKKILKGAKPFGCFNFNFYLTVTLPRRSQSVNICRNRMCFALWVFLCFSWTENQVTTSCSKNIITLHQLYKRCQQRTPMGK